MAALPPSSGNPGGVVGQWGIYDMSGAPVLTASSVAGMEYARDWRVSNYPQEQGAFASYNKVKTPFTAKVTFLVGGFVRRFSIRPRQRLHRLIWSLSSRRKSSTRARTSRTSDIAAPRKTV